MSTEFDFGAYQKKMENLSGESKKLEEKENPSPKPKPTPKPKTITKTITKTEIKIPTMIQTEKLLSKFRLESPTTKFLYNRIVGGSKPDRATIQKYLDFLRFCQEIGEL